MMIQEDTILYLYKTQKRKIPLPQTATALPEQWYTTHTSICIFAVAASQCCVSYLQKYSLNSAQMHFMCMHIRKPEPNSLSPNSRLAYASYKLFYDSSRFRRRSEFNLNLSRVLLAFNLLTESCVMRIYFIYAHTNLCTYITPSYYWF